MPANLKNPFGDSCCDGGECSIYHESARPCGCDPGAGWVCQRHQLELAIEEAKNGTVKEASE